MSSTNKHNKVKFNICNVHYAPLSQDNDGKYTWGTPVALPGAVSLSLDPQGEPESFYADGIEYYVINNNQGYDGDLEVALIPESFRRDILMETTGYVKAKTGDSTTASVYNDWYKSVYQPADTSVEETPAVDGQG